jgi:hypothetical protein
MKAANPSAGESWSIGPVGIAQRQVQRRRMEARLTPWRLLTSAAALVALVALTSGCGGGSDAQAAPRDPPLVEYTSASLSFAHPAAWKAYPFRWAGELHFRPLVYLSTQPLHDPCSTKGNTTSCGFPLRQLLPGGVLITWQASGPPAIALGPGRRTRIDGHLARRVDTTGGMCGGIGADRTIDVLIETQPLPSTLTEFTACLRGPGLAQEEKSVEALLASTKLAGQ